MVGYVINKDMEKKDVKKCYSCRKPIKGKALFCKDCEGKKDSRKHSASTLVFYHTV